jgi:hypothetical protein
LADGDDRAVHRARRVGITMRHEEALEIGEPIARRNTDERGLPA